MQAEELNQMLLRVMDADQRAPYGKEPFVG